MSLEEILAAHDPGNVLGYDTCPCGRYTPGNREWAAHVAAEIRAAFGVVELPPESKDDDWRIDGYTTDDTGSFITPDFGSYVIERTGPKLVLNVKVDGDYFWRDIEPDEARNLAAALLVAANAAEVTE